MVKDVNVVQDEKLQTLLARLKEDKRLKKKVLIFTQYAETATYLYDNLNPEKEPEIEVIDSTRKNRGDIVSRFSPKSNEYQLKRGEKEIRVLIATDVLAA